MKITETMSREERRAAIRATNDNRDHLIAIYRNSDNPADTVAGLIGRIGYQAARETIAEAVNARGEWDQRISARSRAWAASIDTAADRETLLKYYLISDAIHPAHIDQLANEAADHDETAIRAALTAALPVRQVRIGSIVYMVDTDNRIMYATINDLETMDAENGEDPWHYRHASEESEAAQAAEEITADEAPADEAPAEEPDDENRAHCKHIAHDLEAYAEGHVYRCPDCGEEIRMPDSVGDKYRCPHCHNVADVEDYEQLSVYDFLSDVYDVEYRIGSDGEYRSVKIMVACGGPNIYIDTAEAAVKLYWWSDRAEYHISHEARNAVDEWAEELWGCR